ncbi:MAG: hypothetical protein NXY57DRAFT_45321 [Lentinula lateritia]|uniref:Uncharacterized protein n=1 Tax=Lentinula lateritia TaxID=40482 RepID=A0ABQ8VPB5_9AGAR|nr:MAG: hypothetical protein NXY57DRAFT_45321 [Lentinula lateritia]KAJ4498202.1 hypothetical protein C8R41DRAFT_758019 [Lentinula lateritia]
MNLHQRGLVDACFEESQYDEGIALLSQLKSSNVLPSASHIRQLLYFSLYPPTVKKVPLGLSLSPTKIGRQQQKSLTISSQTAALACSLLIQYALTMSTEGVARALPSYDHSNVNGSESSESLIAKESYCISEAKNCWNILQKGFIHRVTTSSPTKRGTRRTTVFDDNDDDDFGASGVVAEHAWPVLDLLLILFERDECETEARGLPRYSPLLLNQIPAPRSEMSVRWEADAPLSIILYALAQEGDEQRRKMGSRLTQLLINLCSTNLFDFTMFLNSVFSRVYTSGPKEFLASLVALPPTLPVLRFRIALLHKFINNGGKSTAQDTSLRSKPQARAKPIRHRRNETKPLEEQTKPQLTSNSILSQITLPPFTEIHRSMEELKPHLSNKDLPYTWIQFQLWTSIYIYQTQLPVGARDKGWWSLLGSEEFPRQLEELFHTKDLETTVYKEILNDMLST